jgi:hypothetical protein
MKDDVARGSKRNAWTTRYIIPFPDDMFGLLQAKARERKTSVNEQVLLYVEWASSLRRTL